MLLQRSPEHYGQKLDAPDTNLLARKLVLLKKPKWSVPGEKSDLSFGTAQSPSKVITKPCTKQINKQIKTTMETIENKKRKAFCSTKS